MSIVTHRPSTSITRRIVGVTLCATATLTLTSSPLVAHAASSTPGDFSALVPNNPRTIRIDDCWAEIGIVVDSVAYPNYRRIGGVRVNCSTRHSRIEAAVALYYHNGSRWVQYGNGSSAARANSYGSGYDAGGILRTPAFCVGGYRAYYWMVGATVRTERTGVTDYSNVSRDTAAGC